MVIRGTPNDLNNYIIVEDVTNMILQENGFIPKYIDSEHVYFIKTKDLLEFIERGNLV